MTFSIPGLPTFKPTPRPQAPSLVASVPGGPRKITKQNLPVIQLNPTGCAKRYDHRCSVSQVESWRGCNRQWGFRSLEKIEGTNRFAARGNAVHAHAENWLVEGIEPPEDDRYGRLVRTEIEFLPLPGTAEIEREFEYISATGVWYVGFLDVWVPLTGPYASTHHRPQVMDHKSTTDLKWSWTRKSGEPLWRNPQAALYGEVACERDRTDEVDLRWNYLIDVLKKPKTVPDNDVAHRANILRVVAEMDETAHEIQRVGRAQKWAKDLEPNPLHCDSYGGCSYQSICGLTDADKLGAIMEQQSIRDRLQAKVGGASASQVASTPAAATQNVQAGGSVLERMKAAKAEADAKAAAAAPAQAPASTPPAASGTFVIPQSALPKAAAPQTTPAAAPAVSVSTPAPTAAPASAMGILERMKAQAANKPAATGTSEKITNAGMAAGLAQIEEEERLAALQDAQPPVAVSYSAADINPPERAAEPIDDPEELAAANAGELAAKAATVATSGETEKRGRGRPAGAKNKAKDPTAQTIQALSDEGYIFGRVFSDALRETRGDITKATECATAAVQAFREI